MKSDDLQIWLAQPRRSPHLAIRWIDPETGITHQKSANTKDKKEAERLLGEVRADLLSSRYETPSQTSWTRFRERYETEVLPSLAKKTALKVDSVFDAVERYLKPKKVRDLTAERLSLFQAKLRGKGCAETTIAGYLAHLRAALRWAYDMGMLSNIPKIPKLRRAKTSQVMKGRPITDEEFGRMLECTAGVVGEAAAASWRHYLEGLYRSGLRLAESLMVSWDEPCTITVVLTEGELMLQIPAELEKGHKDRLLPIAPEFVEFLERTPIDERTGRVFKPMPKIVRGDRLTADRVTRLISRIGKAAKIVTDAKRQKYATAHDLRRSFGERWASRVMPQVLMELMRHESISTTLRFYVGRNAVRTSQVIRQAYEASRRGPNQEC